jgi:hypothetical protein
MLFTVKQKSDPPGWQVTIMICISAGRGELPLQKPEDSISGVAKGS